jgi:hypothetical protein
LGGDWGRFKVECLRYTLRIIGNGSKVDRR